MIGRTPGYIVAVRPLREGAITDFEITERMIRLLLRRVGVSRFNRPRVLICVPSAITAVERRAVKEAARRAGASAAYLIEQPMAAAIGAGLPIHEPVGNMVVDVGGGTAEMAVISLGGVVALQAMRVRRLRHRRRHPDLRAPGVRRWPSASARPRRSSWPSARPALRRTSCKAEIRGREVATGLPKTVDPLPGRGARTRSRTRSGSIVDRGGRVPRARRRPSWPRTSSSRASTWSAAAALLRGLTSGWPTRPTVPVHLVDTPLECVVLGAGICLESFDSLRPISRGRRVLSGQPATRSTPRPADPRPPGGPASRGPRGSAAGRPRPRVRRRRPGPPRPAAARSACRPAPPSTAGRPAGSPMAPSAATAASRHSGIGVRPGSSRARPDAPTAGGRPRSPSDQAAISTTEGSGSARAAASGRRVGNARGQLAAATAHRRRPGRPAPTAMSSSVSTSSRSRAPECGGPHARGIVVGEGGAGPRPRHRRWPASATAAAVRRRRVRGFGDMANRRFRGRLHGRTAGADARRRSPRVTTPPL